nr:putative reverse transcriptase domain-containing protein [Tanacetum cinerariifolium]
MDAPPSPNHVFNFPEAEFEEDPQEEPEEEGKKRLDKMEQGLGDEMQFSSRVEHRVTDVENREQERDEEMVKKSYADKRQKPLEFKVGDRVLLKVSPWKGVVRFGKKGKLAPREGREKAEAMKNSFSKSSMELTTRSRVYLGARRSIQD